MNCLDYVHEQLTEKENTWLDIYLTTRNFPNNKTDVQVGELVVFVYGYHVGFGRLNDYYELETIECSDDKIVTRRLQFFDEKLKIAMINPKLKKGSELNNVKVE